jgi:hypothetical protein
MVQRFGRLTSRSMFPTIRLFPGTNKKPKARPDPVGG